VTPRTYGLSGVVGLVLVAYSWQAGAASLSPVDFLKQVFANYRLVTNFNPLGKGAPGIFSAGLLKLIRQDERNAHGEVGRLDHDPVCDCQDYDVMTGFDYVLTQQTDNRASVSVRFVDGATPTSVSFVLVRTGNEWRIDDVADPKMPSLRRFLTP
jgi:hypothetical protein